MKELFKSIKNAQDFILSFYPDYNESDAIKRNEDLKLILDEKIFENSGADTIYKNFEGELKIYWGGMLDAEQLHNEVIKQVEFALEESNADILQDAVEAFIAIHHPNIDGVWDFVGHYYPGYTGSGDIAENDDLQCIVDNEFVEGSDAEELYNNIKGEMEVYWKGLDEEGIHAYVIVEAQRRLDASNAYVYKEAVENYIKEINL